MASSPLSFHTQHFPPRILPPPPLSASPSTAHRHLLCRCSTAARLLLPSPLVPPPLAASFPNPSSNRCRIPPRCASTEQFGTESEGEGGWDEDEGRGGDELSALDLDSLEDEAKEVARQYSISLSRELSIEDGAYEKKDTRSKQRLQRSSGRHISDHLLPRVAIVGRPNVGKSALFNRLVGGNRAIVVDEPGVTRDRLYGRSFWGDREFMVVDTGGVMTLSKLQDDVMEELQITTTVGMDAIPLTLRQAAVARMPSMIERQAAAAVEEAAVIIFLVDGQEEIVIDVKQIKSSENLTDLFTKALPKSTFQKLVHKIGVRRLHQIGI